MLGLTVENVLERTIIRTVIPHGAAQLAGAQVGSVIVRVGGRECGTLTHFETIDELRQSQRPLKLTLRRIPDAALKEGRREMSRLIQSPSTYKSARTRRLVKIGEPDQQPRAKRTLAYVTSRSRPQHNTIQPSQPCGSTTRLDTLNTLPLRSTRCSCLYRCLFCSHRRPFCSHICVAPLLLPALPSLVHSACGSHSRPLPSQVRRHPSRRTVALPTAMMRPPIIRL